MSRIRPLTRLIVLLPALFAAGCEGLPEAASSVRERLSRREETHERAYAAAPRATYDALKAAAAQLGYRQTRGGAAQGEFERPGEAVPVHLGHHDLVERRDAGGDRVVGRQADDGPDALEGAEGPGGGLHADGATL